MTNGNARKVAVGFSPNVTMRLFDPSPSLEHYEDIWYSPLEMQEQRRREVQVMNSIRSNPTPNKLTDILKSMDRWTDRGLEAFLSEQEQGQSNRNINKLKAILAVLMEQDRQLLEGDTWSDEEISRRYQPLSQKCQQDAHLRALGDYLIALRIHNEKSSATKAMPSVEKVVRHTRPKAVRQVAFSSRAA